MSTPNPFALIRASDYTDRQINSLWVEIGSATVKRIIDPSSKISKYILGGKGTGKTHLLRYHSYQVSRQREADTSGIETLKKHGYCAIFLRATGLDASRFESEADGKWQHLFGVYLELKLTEVLMDALVDVQRTSVQSKFDDLAFIDCLSDYINDESYSEIRTLEEFGAWVTRKRRAIDDAVNNFAFTGVLDVRVPFAIGALSLPICKAMRLWCRELEDIPLIYLIDEIENFNEPQQEVVNSLIRYGEGFATFRVTGRLYGIKTFATISSGEENREGAEFKTTKLDEILRAYEKYPDFAKKFIAKRLVEAGLLHVTRREQEEKFDPSECFEELDSNDLFSKAITSLKMSPDDESFIRRFEMALAPLVEKKRVDAKELVRIKSVLTEGFPPILARLNVLLFCKKLTARVGPVKLAEKLAFDAANFMGDRRDAPAYFGTAYGHWAGDLFAQMCRDSRTRHGVPYAGFDLFIKMSSGNPRNLLVILGHIYDIAAFKGFAFVGAAKLPIEIQTEGAIEAARFVHERDTNYGSDADQARKSVDRLATLLRTARYALSVPEVSPLSVSFSSADLSMTAQKVLNSALNYSFVFETSDGRPDRNSHGLNRKIQINPLLSPNWGLSTGRRGDISLDGELVNSIFTPELHEEFFALLRRLETKWNSPFQRVPAISALQTELF
jgi:hypothetical protein